MKRKESLYAHEPTAIKDHLITDRQPESASGRSQQRLSALCRMEREFSGKGALKEKETMVKYRITEPDAFGGFTIAGCSRSLFNMWEIIMKAIGYNQTGPITTTTFHQFVVSQFPVSLRKSRMSMLSSGGLLMSAFGFQFESAGSLNHEDDNC